MIYDWQREQDFLEGQPNPQTSANEIQIEDLAGPDLKESFGGALLIIGLGSIVPQLRAVNLLTITRCLGI